MSISKLHRYPPFVEHDSTDLEERLAEVEDQLQLEIHKRLLAERKLKEVEKECKAPFVVPALLQALLNISEIDI